MKSERRKELFDKTKRLFEIPMVVITLILLVIIIVQEVVKPLPPWPQILEVVDWVIWLTFVIELVTLTYFAENRIKHLIRSWLDIIIVTVPFLRVLRILRIARLARISRLSRVARISKMTRITRFSRITRVFPLFIKAINEVRSILKKHQFQYILFVAVFLTITLGSLVVLLEKNTPQANIKNVADGIWWATVTVATVGYGDKYPITNEGRIVAIILMILGITLFSLLTANISSFFVEKDEEDKQNEIQKQLQRLEEKVDKIIKTEIN